MKPFITMILIFSFTSFAQTTYQTDWGGGQGVTGPVFEFEDTFLSSSNIDYTSIPGQILLAKEVPSNLGIDQPFYSPLAVYPDSGFLESSIVEIQSSWIPWSYLHFSGTLPASTSIGIQVRASFDYNEMGAWSEIFMYPGYLVGVLEENANYIQYRAILYTANNDTTPRLKDVTLIYSSGGVDGENSPLSLTSLQFSANPAFAPVEAEVTMISAASVEILIFDLSGRLVKDVGILDYQAGKHTLILGDFMPGIYNVHMRLGELSSFYRFTVVK